MRLRVFKAVPLLVMASMVLVGCSSAQRTYPSPSALHDAYIDAGGKCDQPEEIDEAMVGKGAHALMCMEDITMLLVFDSEEAKNRYIAQTVEGDTEAVVGERWAVVGEHMSDYAGPLGGA